LLLVSAGCQTLDSVPDLKPDLMMGKVF